MNLRGIIITGTSGSGKTTVVNELRNHDSRFTPVKAVTTRLQRSDDADGAFDYVSEEQFSALVERGELLVQTSYRNQHSDLEEAEVNSKVPVLVVTPESAVRLAGLRLENEPPAQLPDYLSVFLDAPDAILNERLASRDGNDNSEACSQQRQNDRQHKFDLLYTLENVDLSASVELIGWLWGHTSAGGFSRRD